MNTTAESQLRLALGETRKRIEAELQQCALALGPKTALREGCQYALLSGGKRFRPTIVLWVAEALGGSAAMEAALGVECFHCASLVADDLPCMDDDDERRSQPAVHKVYGESVAMLVTYSLIAEGYDLLRRNADSLANNGALTREQSDRALALAVQVASRTTGILGASGGQYLDLHPPQLDQESLREILEMKTVVLFELSFALGWLYGGGDMARLEDIRKLSYHFGLAFQVADDIRDLEEDAQKSKPVNLALLMGEEAARSSVNRELEAYEQLLETLGIATAELKGLAELVRDRAR